MDNTCAGLGFIHNPLDRGKKHDDSNVDALMGQYMRSCLDYHEQQEKNEFPASLDLSSFIPASESTSNDVSCMSSFNKDAVNGMNTNKKIKLESFANSLKKIERVDRSDNSSWKQEAIANARAIAKRLIMGEVNSTIHTTPPQEYVERREKFSQKHNLKLQHALLKNFSYVMRRDAQDSQILMSQIKQVDYRQHQMSQKRSTAGIGTKEQVRSFQKSELCPTIGFYLTGLPTTHNPGLEETLRTLFGAYGSVNKVIIYTDKRTKKRKGDGLILYQSSPTLIETVCSQVSHNNSRHIF
jgi:hypothetical protein